MTWICQLCSMTNSNVNEKCERTQQGNLLSLVIWSWKWLFPGPNANQKEKGTLRKSLNTNTRNLVLGLVFFSISLLWWKEACLVGQRFFLQMTRICNMTSCLLQRVWPTQQLYGQGSRCLDKQVGCSRFDNFFCKWPGTTKWPLASGCSWYDNFLQMKRIHKMFIFLQVLPGR